MGWISVEKDLPCVAFTHDEPLVVFGQSIEPLYLSRKVLRFDGKNMSVGRVEWFRSGYVNCTHWMELPDKPITG